MGAGGTGFLEPFSCRQLSERYRISSQPTSVRNAWPHGGVPARERPAPAASPPLACSRLRWRGSEIIVLDLQDEDQWESLVSDEEDDEDDDSDDDA